MRPQKVYIASADLMTRNTERRMEMALPILDPELKLNIQEALMNEQTRSQLKPS
jgi:polyphosphate kinase